MNIESHVKSSCNFFSHSIINMTLGQYTLIHWFVNIFAQERFTMNMYIHTPNVFIYWINITNLTEKIITNTLNKFSKKSGQLSWYFYLMLICYYFCLTFFNRVLFQWWWCSEDKKWLLQNYRENGWCVEC